MRFGYLEPLNVEEAISLLVKYEGEAKVLAGGTDLIVQMRKKMVRPKYIIDIGCLPGLDYINYDEKEGLKIGALTTISALERSSEIKQKYPVISQAASKLGCVAVRNVATLGGNLCNASPSADMIPALIGLSATIKTLGPGGEKKNLLENFFIGPGKTMLERGELMTEIQVPLPPLRTGGVYLKHGIRKAIDLAIVGVAAIISLDSNESVKEAKIVLGAVAPTPIRAPKAEEFLKDKFIDEELINKCAELASKEACPISDVRASVEYRREMVKVFTRYSVRDAFNIAKNAKEVPPKREKEGK